MKIKKKTDFRLYKNNTTPRSFREQVFTIASKKLELWDGIFSFKIN